MRLCVGLSIFRKIRRVMCPSHFNPDRCSLNVPETHSSYYHLANISPSRANFFRYPFYNPFESNG